MDHEDHDDHEDREERLAYLAAMADQLEARSRDRKIADRKEYVDGPTAEPTVLAERLWSDGDVDCAVVRAPGMGHLCGYARVPDDHPWVGLHYDDPVPNPAPLDREMLLDEAVEGFGVVPTLAGALDVEHFETTLLAQVRVHGGVTFAGPLSRIIGARHGWWIGFDCNHAGDAIDEAYADVHTKHLQARLALLMGGPGHVWTVDEVALEVGRMADAIHAARRR